MNALYSILSEPHPLPDGKRLQSGSNHHPRKQQTLPFGAAHSPGLLQTRPVGTQTPCCSLGWTRDSFWSSRGTPGRDCQSVWPGTWQWCHWRHTQNPTSPGDLPVTCPVTPRMAVSLYLPLSSSLVLAAAYWMSAPGQLTSILDCLCSRELSMFPCLSGSLSQWVRLPFTQLLKPQS